MNRRNFLKSLTVTVLILTVTKNLLLKEHSTWFHSYGVFTSQSDRIIYLNNMKIDIT
jgi:hypothetical protein